MARHYNKIHELETTIADLKRRIDRIEDDLAGLSPKHTVLLPNVYSPLTRKTNHDTLDR